VILAAEETLGGAVAAIANLPAATGEAVLNVARPAFAHALQVNAAIGVVGFLILSALTITMLRDIMPHTEENEEDDLTEQDIPAHLPTYRQPEPSGD
jgi:membrane protein implicated in regulation of membrane protease activity